MKSDVVDKKKYVFSDFVLYLDGKKMLKFESDDGRFGYDLEKNAFVAFDCPLCCNNCSCYTIERVDSSDNYDIKLSDNQVLTICSDQDVSVYPFYLWIKDIEFDFIEHYFDSIVSNSMKSVLVKLVNQPYDFGIREFGNVLVLVKRYGMNNNKSYRVGVVTFVERVRLYSEVYIDYLKETYSIRWEVVKNFDVFKKNKKYLFTR